MYCNRGTWRLLAVIAVEPEITVPLNIGRVPLALLVLRLVKLSLLMISTSVLVEEESSMTEMTT